MSDRPAEPPPTVLVVDDNLQNREVAEGHLVGAGYQAVQAESGDEALALLRAAPERPDLILLDVLMPGLDGFETCRRIRALPGRHAHPDPVPHGARRSRDAQGGARLGRRRLPHEAHQPHRAPHPRALAPAHQGAVRRAGAQPRGDLEPARRARRGAAAKGGADGAHHPRPQEPAVEHPVERPVRARAGRASAPTSATRCGTCCARRSRWCAW